MADESQNPDFAEAKYHLKRALNLDMNKLVILLKSSENLPGY